ncbi:hypothetical protein FNL37_1774 [Methylovorus glucosotrophus]|uniref:phage major capsid protein n=1 Tax=Methylovorus glucosotrophus TaxID=266009 RepID=UPI001331410A|nr:phage major capsid protein [Methylovorus glucosotrophus]KAF0844330.1 hypothetical protein FNL37_1774 [Methylovorus glucosotrophus]
MALNATEIARIGKVAITAYQKNTPVDQMNVERPLLDALTPKAKDIVGGIDGFTINIFKSNDANGQLYSGNGRVTYNSRNPNDLSKWDWMNHHDGFVLSEDELLRAGIKVNDDIGKSTATASEAVQLTNMIVSQFTALKEGVKDHVHSLLWLDGSQYTNAQPGIDAIVSTAPTSGTIGNIAASNTYWQNIARTGLGTSLAVLLDALEQSKRDIQRRKGRFTHIFVGSAFYDALRNAVIAANVTQVTYGGGSKLSIDMATDTLKFDGIPLTYVPDFDTNFGLSAPAIPWAKRCYMLNLSAETSGGIQLHRDSEDFMRMRYPGRPIDQYTYHFAMTSKFGLGCGKRNSNAVLALA